MAIPVWPLGLPSAEYEYEPVAPFERTEMDSGIARHRRRFRVYPIVVDVNFLMTQDQLKSYESFCREDLGGWVSWFMLTIKDGEGLRSARSRFVGKAPRVKHVPGGHWTVSGQIETLVGGKSNGGPVVPVLEGYGVSYGTSYG